LATARRVTNAASVVAASGMLGWADSARICASGHGYLLASPRRRVAHYHDEDVKQQERYSIEEQARDDRRDRRALPAGESPAAVPVRFSNRLASITTYTTRPIALPIATQAHPRRR
jgi:hypothetical protein